MLLNTHYQYFVFTVTACNQPITMPLVAVWFIWFRSWAL